jgi:hypothetical protein
MDYCLNEVLDVAAIVFDNRKSGFIRFSPPARPVIFWDTSAVEIRGFTSITGELTAAEFQELRQFIRRPEELILTETVVTLVNEDGTGGTIGRTPDIDTHTAARYFYRLGPVFDQEEVPVGALWGSFYRQINGETVSFDLLNHPYRLAEYGRIPLNGKVPLFYHWADGETFSVPVLEICFGYCRFFSVGI